MRVREHLRWVGATGIVLDGRRQLALVSTWVRIFPYCFLAASTSSFDYDHRVPGEGTLLVKRSH